MVQSPGGGSVKQLAILLFLLVMSCAARPPYAQYIEHRVVCNNLDVVADDVREEWQNLAQWWDLYLRGDLTIEEVTSLIRGRRSIYEMRKALK